jgi:hypothetical protein
MPESDLPKSQSPGMRQKTVLQRVISIVAIFVCCGFLSCAGCCVLTMALLGPKNFDTPEGAEKVAADILSWTLPKNFAGKSAAVMDNFLMRFEVARFVQKQGRGNLVLGQLHYKWMPGTDLHLHLLEIVEKIAPDLKKIDVAESETRSPMINGAKAQFEIQKGEDRATTTRYRRVIGHFQQRLNTVIVILECEEEFLADEDLEDFINSIH